MSLSPSQRQQIESWVRPLYVELDGVDTFGLVARRQQLATRLIDGAAADGDYLELLALFHGPGRRLGSTDRRGRWWLFLHGLGLSDDLLHRLSAGLGRWQVTPQGIEEEALHDAVLMEDVGILACAQRIWQAGRKRVPLDRVLATLDAGAVAERFKTAAGSRLAAARREAANVWIEGLIEGVALERLEDSSEA